VPAPARSGALLRELAGVRVELHRRSGEGPERYEATGSRGVTGPDGSYRIVLPWVTGPPWYTAVAATPGAFTWAGRGTGGTT
jgi:hypothetical protein